LALSFPDLKDGYGSDKGIGIKLITQPLNRQFPSFTDK